MTLDLPGAAKIRFGIQSTVLEHTVYDQRGSGIERNGDAAHCVQY